MCALFPACPGDDMGRLPFPAMSYAIVFPPYQFVAYLRGLDPVPRPRNLIIGGNAGVLSYASNEVPSPLSLAIVERYRRETNDVFASVQKYSFLLRTSLTFLVELVDAYSVYIQSV